MRPISMLNTARPPGSGDNRRHQVAMLWPGASCEVGMRSVIDWRFNNNEKEGRPVGHPSLSSKCSGYLRDRLERRAVLRVDRRQEDVGQRLVRQVARVHAVEGDGV